MITTDLSTIVAAGAFLLFLVVAGLMLAFPGLILRMMERLWPDYMTRRALRLEQRLQDTIEADKRARELREQQMLDWAYLHPDTPEGRRRLLKERDEVLKRLERANWDVENSTSMLGMVRDAGKKAEYETKLAEARQRQNDEAQKLADLDRVLNPEDVAATQ